MRKLFSGTRNFFFCSENSRRCVSWLRKPFHSSGNSGRRVSYLRKQRLKCFLAQDTTVEVFPGSRNCFLAQDTAVDMFPRSGNCFLARETRVAVFTGSGNCFLFQQTVPWFREQRSTCILVPEIVSLLRKLFPGSGNSGWHVSWLRKLCPCRKKNSAKETAVDAFLASGNNGRRLLRPGNCFLAQERTVHLFPEPGNSGLAKRNRGRRVSWFRKLFSSLRKQRLTSFANVSNNCRPSR